MGLEFGRFFFRSHWGEINQHQVQKEHGYQD
jgi:hypothetical protein